MSNEQIAPTPAAVGPHAGPRYPLIDSMRGIAAMLVLVFHATYVFGVGMFAAYVTQRVSGPPMTAVVIFFVISGFVLYRPFAAARLAGDPAPGLLSYAVRRVARIVPAYWVALTVVSVMLSQHYVHTPVGIVRYFGFAQLYAPLNVVGGGIAPAWTLCTEVTFYAVLPLLAYGIRRLGGRSFLRSELTLCGLLVAVSLCWQLVFLVRLPTTNQWLIPVLGWLPGTLDLFAFGMGLAALSVAYEAGLVRPRWVDLAARHPWVCWALAFASFYAVGRLGEWLAGRHFGVWFPITHELKALGSFCLLLPLVFSTPRVGVLRRVLGSRPLLYLGTISYGIYLWHDPLLHKLGPTLTRHGEWFTYVGLAAVSIAVASASYFVIERPAQRQARRYLRSRRPAPAPAAPLPAGVTPPTA
jgi:peptidoglycan/LPS O-acetylase OafA/YrhL